MKCIKVDLPRDIKELNILPISDWHLGSKECDNKLIKRVIETIRNNDNTYTVLNGDLIDNATKTSVGDTYESTMSPMEQMKQVINLLEPIKDKILCGCSGNHEGRSYKTDGIDLTYFLMREFGLHDRYDATSNLLFLRFGELPTKESNGSGENRKVLYTIYNTHGSGSGRTAGGKANGLERMKNIVNADVNIISHTHFPMTFKEKTYEIDTKNSTVLEKEITFVNTGSTLGYGGYSERFTLTPSSKAQPIVLLDGRKKEVRVVL